MTYRIHTSLVWNFRTAFFDSFGTSTFSRLTVYYDPWPFTLAQKTIHCRFGPSTLAQMTVHVHPFGPDSHYFMVYHTLRLIMNLLRAVTLSNFSDNFPTSFKLSNFSQNFPTAAKLSNFSETFQLEKKLSNFVRFFPTSLGSFQLQSVLSNFARFFPTSLGSFQLRPNFPTSDFPT